jgi:hypothetical protein
MVTVNNDAEWVQKEAAAVRFGLKVDFSLPEIKTEASPPNVTTWICTLLAKLMSENFTDTCRLRLKCDGTR